MLLHRAVAKALEALTPSCATTSVPPGSATSTPHCQLPPEALHMPSDRATARATGAATYPSRLVLSFTTPHQ